MLASQAVSAQAPPVAEVNVDSVEPLTGTVALTWTATDPDVDALTYDVLYSQDGGATFISSQLNAPVTGTHLDTTTLPGGDLILRVRANDGVNTAFADSQPIAVAPKPPQPVILIPPGGTHFEYGLSIPLAGYVFDKQDQFLTDPAQLSWTVQTGDRAPQVAGSGTQTTLQDLAPGLHTVSLHATNSAGLTAVATLVLTISDNLNDPPPALAVNPSQVAWQVENGATAPQTAQVRIVNGGGPGTLDWSASSDAAWLTLDATAGTGEAALTLGAATDGLEANSTLTATVTITANHAGGQETIQVPVLLQVGAGSVWAPPAPQSLPYRVMIPLVGR